ncbi:MAG: hypothetical protein E6H07_03405 [Bacteroidetes bacterium]|nr:MAG: hypothetical protein E6H07_03405 [Bacteroidota bacterium]
MKRILFLLTTLTFSVAMIGQGNSDGNKDKAKDKGKPVATDQSGKSKDKEKADKEKKERADHDKKIWEGTSDKSGGPKASKNQPTKVSSAFQRDYPNATNVYWTKYRGDWTATFGNGIWRSTAVYHANGDRRDTRTLVSRESIPRKILDVIFKQKPEAKVDEAIKIEVPKGLKDIFRIKDIINGKAEFQYYNADGIKVQYNY